MEHVVLNTDEEERLFSACQNGDLETVQSLSRLLNVRDKSTPYAQSSLHYAASCGHLDIVRYLVTEAHSDPLVKDNDGQTPLHYACEYGVLDVVRFLVTEGHCEHNVKDNDGWTPLHCACLEGHLNIVRYLVTEAHCDPNIKDNDGWTPLHYACRDKAVAVADCLLADCHCDPNCSNSNGATPLAMIREPNIIRLLLQHGAETTNLYKCRDVLPKGASLQPARSSVAVFMVGDEGAGKSTLTKALMTERGGISAWAAKRIKFGSVKKKTAGIECHTIHSSRIGSFTIYDLAGHREFHNSHNTVIRSSIAGPSSGMFLFIVDLTACLEDLKQTLSYWLSFIQSQVHGIEHVHLEAVSKPYLLVVGSHADLVQPKRTLEEKEGFLCHVLEIATDVNFVGYVAIDCRYSESPALTLLRSHIRDTYEKLQGAIPQITFHVHCLHVYLVSKCGGKPGMKLGDLITTIESNPLSKEQYLPQNIESLHKTCCVLKQVGILLYIQRKCIEDGWVILDKDVLLREINGSVFAPEDFREYKELTRTGVVPFSKICSELTDLIRAKKIDPQLIVDFLVHMEFCREMTEDDGLRLVTETHPKYKEDRHFLFAALTPPNPPPGIWQPNPLINYSEYSSCWLLQCCEHHHYLTSRFREVLLLRLAFTHAFPVEPTHASPALHQKCSIWKYGIKWTTRSFVDALVEVNDVRVVFLMRCKEEKELAVIKLRSQVIKEIISIKAEFCSNVETIEHFIPYPTYPVDTKSSVPLTDIAHAICSHEDAVLLNKDTPIEILSLLFFEPYKFCNSQCLHDIYTNESCKVKQQFVHHISDNISHVNEFCKMLLNVPLLKIEDCSSDRQKAVRMFQVWQSQSEGTYHCLRQHMDQYSIFAGRDILMLARVLQAVATSTTHPTQFPPVTQLHKLDSRPTLQELQSRDLLHSRQHSSVIEGMAVRWSNVAIALSINSCRIGIIERDSHNVEDACIKMLQWWLENAENPTWRVLIEALRDISDLQVLVHNAEKSLQ